jgi:hypothetical protein
MLLRLFAGGIIRRNRSDFEKKITQPLRWVREKNGACQHIAYARESLVHLPDP